MTRQATCAERIGARWQGRGRDLRALLDAADGTIPEPDALDDRRHLTDLGVEADALDDVEAARESAEERLWELPLDVATRRVVTILLSTGGPEDAIDVFLDADGDVIRIEYVFKDWFDGARLPLEGDDFDTAERFYHEVADQYD